MRTLPDLLGSVIGSGSSEICQVESISMDDRSDAAIGSTLGASGPLLPQS